MTAMLMPAVNQYFAIYTLGDMDGAHRGKPAWDLHATATDRTLAISHARMLALQPGVGEVHVKQVIENLTSGLVSVREIKRCKRGNAINLTNVAMVASMAGFFMVGLAAFIF
jgi:hypothetical protein